MQCNATRWGDERDARAVGGRMLCGVRRMRRPRTPPSPAHAARRTQRRRWSSIDASGACVQPCASSTSLQCIRSSRHPQPQWTAERVETRRRRMAEGNGQGGGGRRPLERPLLPCCTATLLLQLSAASAPVCCCPLTDNKPFGFCFINYPTNSNEH